MKVPHGGVKTAGMDPSWVKEKDNTQNTLKPPGLLFADDCAALCGGIADAKTLVELMGDWAKKFGMVFGVNTEGTKTALAVFGPTPEARQTLEEELAKMELKLTNKLIPIVKMYVYLGIPIHVCSVKLVDFSKMAGKEWGQKMGKRLKGISRILSSRRFPRVIGIRLIQAVVLAGYGGELFGGSVSRMAPLTSRFHRACRLLVGQGARLTSDKVLATELGLESPYSSSARARSRAMAKWTESYGVIRDLIASPATYSWSYAIVSWLHRYHPESELSNTMSIDGDGRRTVVIPPLVPTGHEHLTAREKMKATGDYHSNWAKEAIKVKAVRKAITLSEKYYNSHGFVTSRRYLNSLDLEAAEQTSLLKFRLRLVLTTKELRQRAAACGNDDLREAMATFNDCCALCSKPPDGGDIVTHFLLD